MTSPEDLQMEIYQSNANLEEIVSNFVEQQTAIPFLVAENEKKCQETQAALHVTRSYNEEIERLKLENMKLTAKRVQLKSQCEDIINALERARETRVELEASLKKEEHEMELQIRKYSVILRELANCFRRCRADYNEEEIKNEMEVLKKIIFDLKKEQQSRQTEVSDLKCKLSGLVNDVPENILSIVGKEELDKKLQSLVNECETLRSQHCKYTPRDRAGTSSTTSGKY